MIFSALFLNSCSNDYYHYFSKADFELSSKVTKTEFKAIGSVGSFRPSVIFARDNSEKEYLLITFNSTARRIVSQSEMKHSALLCYEDAVKIIDLYDEFSNYLDSIDILIENNRPAIKKSFQAYPKDTSGIHYVFTSTLKNHREVEVDSNLTNFPTFAFTMIYNYGGEKYGIELYDEQECIRAYWFFDRKEFDTFCGYLKQGIKMFNKV